MSSLFICSAQVHFTTYLNEEEIKKNIFIHAKNDRMLPLCYF